ncbi:TetR/AcrR family transcriptional regulator [Chelativorans salis]|uniref:TetR/AcrR family transcriptional regulator n=1 Tax=Chelativorans salis TaxID=2978478 RepID=A0ABT2LP20_9HYPH|nr:TetR/AcrR family transcriptional regulator [Chelativorans sp. EGI FJ00035]MCT7376310.1 TetR/AcrR family transcriptional regulator [Chelativorans sp. EGI FJ00035]
MTRKAGGVGTATRSYHHGYLKAALIAAAGEMLERDGPEAISFRAVARAAGVSQTAPYNHFRGKEDLLATLAEAGFRELEASQLATMGATVPGLERVIRLGLDYVRFASTRPQSYRLMFGVGVSDWRGHQDVAEAKNASFRPIKDALAEYLSSDMTPEAVEIAAIAAWAQVHGLSMLLMDGSLGAARRGHDGGEALVRQVLTQFAAGLVPGAKWPT